MSQKKDDLPAMPFYVGDWLKAPDIQCLTYDLKGLWFEMLCYMWESKERGVLLYSIDELSRLLRLPDVLLKQKIEQLKSKDILSIRDDGAIYCRRMVRDQEIRIIRTKAGSMGGRRTFASYFAKANSQAKCENESVIENEIVLTDDKGVKGEKKGHVRKYVADQPPSLEDVAKYCLDRKNGIDAQVFIDKNATIGWKDKNGILYQDWKAVVRTWENFRKATDLKTPVAAAPAKRPIGIVVIEKIAAGKSDHDILHDLIGTYTEHDINETLMHARGKVK